MSESTGRQPFSGDLYQPVFDPSWCEHSLYSLADWTNGLAFRDIQFTPNGKPVIRIAEIKNGITSQTNLTDAEYEPRYLVSPRDMLFSWSGQPETSIDVSWWDGPAGWLNQHIFKVEPDVQRCETVFFFYLLRYLRPHFVAIARNKQTTGLGHVTRRDLERLSVSIPPLPTQRAIARILGALDDKIELNRRINATLEAIARALFKSWFVDFDPVRAKAAGRQPPGLDAASAALFPDRFVDSELGEIPEGWRVGKLGDAVSLSRESVNPGSSPDIVFSHYSIPAYDEGQEPRRERGETIKSQKFCIPHGAVLISKLNPEVERVWLTDVGADDLAICSTEFLVCRAQQPFTSAFVYSLARASAFRQQLQGMVTGTSKSHQRVQPDAMLNIDIAIPSSEVLGAFDAAVALSLARCRADIAEARTLAALRDALLPKLLSGELPVPEAEERVEEVL